MAAVWVLERAANPRVIRLHVVEELTAATIETCPPAAAPAPLDRLLEVGGVRSLDLHRYRARINLDADAQPAGVIEAAGSELERAWGPSSALRADEGPRAFEVERHGERRVAESPEMARDDPVLAALFRVRGVVEAIAGDGLVLVRLGRLFRWEDAQDQVAVAAQKTVGGTPGSTPSPV